MRRGFLFDKPKGKKALSDAKADAKAREPRAEVAKAESVQFPQYQLQYGKVDASLPTDFKPDYKVNIDHTLGMITSERKNLVLVTLPPKGSPAAVNESDHTEWITQEATKPRVFNAPGYPQPVPKPTGRRPSYEVKMTPNMGMGVFARRNIKAGELVFAERPLLVAPVNVNILELRVPGAQYQRFLLDEYEKIIAAGVNRMSLANQAAYKSLMNSHTEDGSGPCTGVLRTNGYVLGVVFDGPGTKAASIACSYSAIGNVASRINHSCVANVHRGFDLAAFSFTFKALSDINAGEQLFYAYCETEASVAVRRQQLAPYGVVCECRACTNATPESDRFREEYPKRTKEFEALNTQVYQGRNHTWPTNKEFEELLKFQATAIEEGIQNQPSYQHVLGALVRGYMKKQMQAKALETLDLMKKNSAIFDKTTYV